MVKKFVIISLILLMFGSCKFFSDFFNNQDQIKNTYNLNVVWKLQTERYFSNRNYLKIDNYLYFDESDEDYNDVADYTFCISKVDLDTGRYVWKTNRINACMTGWDSVKKIQDYIFVLSYRGKIYVYSDIDGSLVTTVFLGNDDEEKKIFTNSESSVTYNEFLIWDVFSSNGIYKDDGIVKLNINEIDYTKESQVLIPEYIWRRNEEDKQCAANFMIEKDGILYFETCARDDLWSFIYAVDLEKNEILWRKYTNGMWGTGQNCLYILDNRLYSIENRIGCYDISKEGCSVFEIEENNGIYLGGHSTVGGITYSGGYFYYTTSSSPGGNIVGTPRELIKNIFCIRPSDFKIVWCDLDYKTGSLYSKVVVENNKAFVFGEDRIRVYNAATGKLLGINDEVGTWVFENATTYNGNVIFFNTDRKTKTSVLTAIKA